MPSDLVLPPATYRTVADAQAMLARLDVTADRLGMRAELVRSTRVRDAHRSAHLAGINVHLHEALVAHLVTSQKPETIDQSATARLMNPYLRAYEHGLARVDADDPVDGELIGQMSAIMTGSPERTLPEVLRQGHGWLGRSPRQAYLLTAMGAHLVGLVQQWSTWVREEHDQPRIAKMAIAHYHLEVLQPFPAANGHVARAFSTLEMVRSGLLRDQILPLSPWLDDNLEEYQRQIRAVVDTGEIHHWVDFFATAVHDQAEAQLRLITQLHCLAERLAPTSAATGILPDVIARLVAFPVINNPELCLRYGVTPEHAAKVTRALVEVGVLQPWEGLTYRRVFQCVPALNLFSLNADSTADA
ncbi:Fic family protein [Umezawaea sp. Da 62-37]|uniref:Fic family protein n=1 Tax=Umezawaea sp. Da 62-37 TaxID=3075927 RepID=UPI0028F6D896|nr:Fic family protein [Umezawaea sp. Da 62-37]WNV84731.1 Fic family protein [Umezawaea sp. Da 62-37]